MKWGTFTHLIGLHGKARAGKDTACKFIQEWGQEEGRIVERDAFADRLKISAARAIGIDAAEVDVMNDLKQDGGRIQVWLPDGVNGGVYLDTEISGREYLQRYGTESHRELFGDDFWIKAVLYPKRRYDLLVITDVRFENEAQAIEDNGGEVWHILRDGSGAGDHSSEQPISDEYIDLTLDNNGSPYDLRDQVFEYLNTPTEFEEVLD